jgi:hypothetical protein
METSRKDVDRNKKQVLIPELDILGYSSNILKYGDFFVFSEKSITGSLFYTLAKSHGQIKPHSKLEKDDPIPEWYILAQCCNSLMTSTYERWIKPEQVVEMIPAIHVNPFIRKFFLAAELGQYSLEQVDKLFGEGKLKQEQIGAWVEVWNDTPGRLTTAKVMVNYIHLEPKD